MSSDRSLADRATGEISDLWESPQRWIFLVGDRPVVGITLFATVLCIFYAIYWAGLIRLRNPTAMLYLLSSLVGGNLTLVTLVISINQVIISRQLRSPGELRRDIEQVNEYRRQALDPREGDVLPVTPAGFLRLLLENVRRDLQRLGGLAVGSDSEALREDTDTIVTELTDHIDRVVRLIEGSGAGTFDTLSALLTTNYADRIYQIQRLKAVHQGEYSESANDLLDEIVSELQELDVARQYFKSLYIQTELAYISRVLLYAGVLSEVVLLSALLVLSSSDGASVPGLFPPVLAPLVVAVGLLPLAVLFSYALRLAVVTQRTIAITPFTTPEQEDELNL